MSLGSALMRPRFSFNLSVTTVSAAASSAQVAPSACTAVRFACTNDCYVFISSNGSAKTAVADGTGCLIRASTAGEYFKVAPGDYISCIQVSVGGVLNVTFMSA